MRVALGLLCSAALVAAGGCGGDDESEPAKSPSSAPAGTTASAGTGGAPSAAEVRSIALKEIGNCPKQRVREFLSAATRKRRGVVESPMLYCDGLPAGWYVPYEKPHGFRKDPGGGPNPQRPYFIDGNVFVTAVLTAPGNDLPKTLPTKIKQDCG